MKLSITKAIREPSQQRFFDLLLDGAFPEVNYSEVRTDEGVLITQSYNLFDYSLVWARYMKYIDQLMKERVDPALGAFTRKRSKGVITELEKILSEITEEDIRNCPDRFNTWMD